MAILFYPLYSKVSSSDCNGKSLFFLTLFKEFIIGSFVKDVSYKMQNVHGRWNATGTYNPLCVLLCV